MKLDAFLVRFGKEKLQELIQKAKPTLELHIERDMRTERILEEIAKLKSESERDKWVKLISSKRKISQRAISRDLKRHIPKEHDDSVEKKYTAYFPELVDLVEDESGNITFLLRDGEELVIKLSVEIDGEAFYAPKNEQLPFKFLPSVI